MDDNYIGKFLDNRYEILEKIGTGGMAVVYKARCHRLNRLVAVKILKADLAQDEDFRRRFRAESQAVAMLSHPNIVAVYDVSSSGNTEYIVMELIEGITLKQYINRKGILNWKEALHFTMQIAKALSHAHSRGIIHRDIKPHNIMILKDGSVKVADFGIARLLSTQNTLTHEALGSVHYISPEQAKGGRVDTRSDLYSVGVVMYEMLTNRLPFEGDSAVSVAIQHISSIPLMPRDINPNIPVGLEQITMHAMESNVDSRYRSADAMLHDLEEFRKNPEATFDYSLFAHGISEIDVDQETRVLSTDEVASFAAAMPKKKPAAKASRAPAPKKEAVRKNERKTTKSSMVIGIIAVVLFVIALIAVVWNFVLKDMLNSDSEKIQVEDFVGKFVDAVIEDDDYNEIYKFSISHEISDEYPEGYIMDQDPAAGHMVAPDSHGKIEVTLTIASEKEPVLMPDILNMDYREAQSMLENLKMDLNIVVEAEPSEEVTPGFVIEQYPAKDSELIEGGTVYITYSTAPDIEYVSVPTVVDLTESEAILRLESYDLSYKVEHVDSSAAKGKVVFQSYEPGASVPLHTQVVIRVSKGPAVVEPQNPTTPDNGQGGSQNTDQNSGQTTGGNSNA